MDAVTKSTLKQYIEELKEKQLIEADIRQVVEEFKHYKQVNKKFTDKLEAMGYHAYMLKEHSHKLRVTKNVAPYKNVSVEIYVYGESLTWEKILTELDRCGFKGNEEIYTRRLANFDYEMGQLKEIEAYLNQKEKLIEGFSLYQLKHKLEDCIRISLDER